MIARITNTTRVILTFASSAVVAIEDVAVSTVTLTE